MPFEVNPDSLRQAAAALALLPEEIDHAPQVKSQPVADALKGSAVGDVLAGLDAVSSLAKAVLQARFNEFSGALALSADKFHGSDVDAAQRIATVADFNSGNPAEPALPTSFPGR
ncbi:hypothetical protein ACWDSJ_06110 [Nocardia sp. NPDC003482]